MAGACFRVLRRKRFYDEHELEETKFRRCLHRWDVTALGVGSTMGVGLYVVLGFVTVNVAGPSVVLSFLIAGVAALFSGLCYAEFSARLPRAGSAYTYTYHSLGELAGFLVGWNIILETLFGAASIARGLSLHLDSLTDGAMTLWFTSTMPLHHAYLSPYFDFFAFLAALTVGVSLMFSIRGPVLMNNVFVVLNAVIILFLIISGATRANSNNWFLSSTVVPEDFGNGGFFSYGVWGVLKGAAICFYAYSGFEVITYSSEEVQEPRRSVSQSILMATAALLVVYVSVAIVTTMMVPYFLQDEKMSVSMVFTAVGMSWAHWVISVGAVFGITSCLFGAMYTLPRLLYTMSSDGLFIKGFNSATSRWRSPLIATAFSSTVIATLAALLDLDQLIMTVCVGTLISYTSVAVGVILLRYRSEYYPPRVPSYLSQMIGHGAKAPSIPTARVAYTALALFVCTCVCLALVSLFAQNKLIPTVILHIIALILLIIMALQPTEKETLAFKTPLIPIVPCLSIYFNIYLMAHLGGATWIRVLVWMAVGLIIYSICIICLKQHKNRYLESNLKYSHTDKNQAKGTVEIIVETATPYDSLKRNINTGVCIIEEDEIEVFEKVEDDKKSDDETKNKELEIQHALVDSNDEKEAKIIDLLDQVLQAEEDTYSDETSVKEQNELEIAVTSKVNEPQIPLSRKSLSELSDAGSEASFCNQGLSKYDVIAQVHREDLPKLDEVEKEEPNGDIDEHEQVTAFNEPASDSESRTDESGYFDAMPAFNDSTEDPHKDDIVNIPTPPPIENFLRNINFKKSHTISVRSVETKHIENEINKPRESVQSNTSTDDGHMIFGSDKQMNFISKLNSILQNKVSENEEDDSKKRRSNSAGNVLRNTEFDVHSKHPLFMDFKKELIAKVGKQDLRTVDTINKSPEDEEEEPKEEILNKEDLKSKLESILAHGGPKLLKPRLMKSNPSTPEDAYQTDTSSAESTLKLQKMEKNDTLKRQKDKFGAVLDSFRLSLNKGEDV